jgi:hypothetical protein
MHWNGSEVVNNQESPEVDASRVSSRVSCLLLAVSIVILVTSLAMRWIISDPNWFSMSITMCSFVVYNVILFVIWTHPQRLTSSNPTLKVPCVPWIPVGSTLFHCIMLFQLPALSWIVSSLWLLTGTTYKIIGLNSVVNMLPLSLVQEWPSISATVMATVVSISNCKIRISASRAAELVAMSKRATCQSLAAGTQHTSYAFYLKR